MCIVASVAALQYCTDCKSIPDANTLGNTPYDYQELYLFSGSVSLFSSGDSIEL